MFLFDSDRYSFLHRLAAVVERYELACVAHCLMTNHYHLVVQKPDGRISNAMRDLNFGYSRQFNFEHGRSAHLFRNRFLAKDIDTDEYFMTVCRYVVNNPVRAGLCRDAAEWPWSSYRATAGLDPTPAFVGEALIRGIFGGADWRDRYRRFVASAADPEVDKMVQFRHT